MTRAAVVAEGFAVRVGSARLVGPLDLEVPARGLVLFEGASGSGKSTLLRAIAGLPLPGEAEGRLDVLGRPAPDGPRRPDEVAFVPQDPREALLAADVLGEASFRLENLGVPEAEGLARARAALARAGLGDLERRASGTLSGGEARRVALAAALAARPRIVLLDEPLAGLDAAWRRRVVADLAAAAEEAAVVVAEHRTAPLAPLASRRFVLGGPVLAA